MTPAELNNPKKPKSAFSLEAVTSFFSNWLVFAVSFVFSLVTFVFFLWPGFWDVKAKNEERNKNKTLLQDEVLPKIEVLKNQKTEELSDYLLTAELFVPAQPNPAALFTIIENSASQSGLKVSNLSLVGITNTAQTKEVNLALTLVGSEDNLISFSQEITKKTPLVKIAKLTVLGSTDSNDKSLSLTLASPFLAIPDNLGEIGKTVSAISGTEKNNLEVLKKTYLEPLRQNQGAVLPTPLPYGKTNPF